MAEFKVCELEGMRWVQIEIRNETVRAEAGALSYLQGDIRITAKPPSPLSALKSAISNEALVRPSYTGTGTINLESSLGGYHPFEVAGQSWILENGAYWASEGGVQLGLHRERVWTSFWTGEGFIDYQTKVSGSGRVVLNAPGPVEEVTLKNERLMVEGKLVLARTEGPRLPLPPRHHADPVVVRRRGPAAGLRRHRQGAGVLDAVLEQVCHADDGPLTLASAGRSSGRRQPWQR